MARPKVPLLSRRNIVAATLGILEREGAEALSVRRIADELGVNAASLYHHFTSKEDIVATATRAALAEMSVPEFDPTRDEWIDWYVTLGIEHRRFLIARPYMVPLIAQGAVPRHALPVVVASDVELLRLGVAGAEDRAYLHDAIYGFVVGSALMAINSAPMTGSAKRQARDISPEEATFGALVRVMAESLIERAANSKRVAAGA